MNIKFRLANIMFRNMLFTSLYIISPRVCL